MIATPIELSAHERPGRGRGRAPPRKRSLQEDLRQSLQVVRFRHAGRRRARTDASGHSVLEDLAPGLYRELHGRYPGNWRALL